MSGGLRHQSDEKKRPSYLVGYKLADKASHPVKGTQCICAEASSVLELMKFITPNTLTGADVLRDVEKLFSCKIRKNEIASGCVISDLLRSQDISYPPNFAHLRGRASFSKPTRDYT